MMKRTNRQMNYLQVQNVGMAHSKMMTILTNNHLQVLMKRHIMTSSLKTTSQMWSWYVPMVRFLQQKRKMYRKMKVSNHELS